MTERTGSAGGPRVAIVHERFTEFAGSEQVVAQLAEQWPGAQVHAPVVDPQVVPAAWRDRVHGTVLSRGLRGDTYAHLLPALPVAMARLRLGDPDVVVASHHAFADQVVRATTAPVIAYVHSPARWVWDAAMRADEVGGVVGRAGLAAFAAAYRPLDRAAAGRLRAIVANSREVAQRVERWWGQDAGVVHPPVDTEYYTPGDDASGDVAGDPTGDVAASGGGAGLPAAGEPFFLLAGRLVPYKQPTVAIRAAARAGVPLVVAGDGRSRAECEAAAGPHTRFLGRVSDDDLRTLFRRATAVLMPGIEDFGIVPVEAQACGSPVIATGEGGALDSVVPGVTGELVEGGPGLEDRWAEAFAAFDPARYDRQAVRTHAEGFSRARFRARMAGLVDDVLAGRA